MNKTSLNTLPEMDEDSIIQLSILSKATVRAGRLKKKRDKRTNKKDKNIDVLLVQHIS